MRYKLISSDWSCYVMCVDWRCTAPLGDNLIYCRNIVHPELRCCYPSLKWEVPVTKSSVGDIFRPFLKGLKINRLQTSGRRLGPPEKALHVFSSGLLPVTSNFWLAFKLKRWEGQRVWQGWPAYFTHQCWRKAGFAVAWDWIYRSLCHDWRAPESSQRPLDCLTQHC